MPPRVVVRGRRHARLALPIVPPTNFPSNLALVAGQVPDWDNFPALMRATAMAAVNVAPTILTCPVSSWRYIRLQGSVEYGPGPPQVSLPWGAALDTVTFCYQLVGANRFVDFNLLTGVRSNDRAAPGAQSQLNSGFSRLSASAQKFYYFKHDGTGNRVLTEYNSATNADIGTVKNLAATFPNEFHQWLHISDDDDDFTFMSQQGLYFGHYRRSTNTEQKKTLVQVQAVDGLVTSFDEPHTPHSGDGTVLTCNPARTLWWDYTTDTLTAQTGPLPDSSHGDGIGSHFVCNSHNARDYDPAAQSAVNRYNFGEIGDSSFHFSCQWTQLTAALADRFWGRSGQADGRPLSYNNHTWVLHSGTIGVDAIYRVVLTYFGGSGQSAARMAAKGNVMQYITGRTQYRQKFTKRATLAAVVGAGEWYFDQAGGAPGAANTVYVRPLDALDLTGANNNMIYVACNPDAAERIVYGKLSASKEIRGGPFSYTLYDSIIFPADLYSPAARAHMFQSGRGWLTNSNMGVANGTSVLWALLPPLGA